MTIRIAPYGVRRARRQERVIAEPEVADEGIRVEALSKTFGQVQALAGVSLRVLPGEIVAVLGRNGAGKSTLLRILATTVLPDSGRAYVAGYDVTVHPREVRRRTGIVFADERSWYWRLTGRANLEFFAALGGMRRAAAAERSDELLGLVQLGSRAEQRFDAYSSGMRARLSVARSLLTSPRVLLLDEPTRTLDPAVARDMRQLLIELARSEQHAVLWVTHDLEEARDVADRLLFVDAGEVRAELAGDVDVAHLHRLFRDSSR